MGFLNIFKKKEPGTCSACKASPGEYRCPVCGSDYCEACVRKSARTLEETDDGPRITVNIVSGGAVDKGASRGIESRVQERIDAMRRITRAGGGVCLGCSVSQGRAIVLKKL